MSTKSATISRLGSTKPNVKRLVNVMTMIAWAVLVVGVLLCVMNLGHFSDQNIGLMVGIGFLIGSVHIYVIGTAIGLVHARMSSHAASEQSLSDEDQR